MKGLLTLLSAFSMLSSPTHLFIACHYNER
ncbi:lipoprotein [Bacillus changyiensis]